MTSLDPGDEWWGVSLVNGLSPRAASTVATLLKPLRDGTFQLGKVFVETAIFVKIQANYGKNVV